MREHDNEEGLFTKVVKGLLKIIVLAIVIAALILFGKWLIENLGLGKGDGEGDGEDVPAAGTISETVAEDTANQEQGGAIVIEVADEKITADGQAMADTAALKEYLLKNGGDDKAYILRDNMAVKSAYDGAKAVLDELGWEYAEDEVQ